MVPKVANAAQRHWLSTVQVEKNKTGCYDSLKRRGFKTQEVRDRLDVGVGLLKDVEKESRDKNGLSQSGWVVDEWWKTRELRGQGTKCYC